jgi:hypothetical protein
MGLKTLIIFCLVCVLFIWSCDNLNLDSVIPNNNPDDSCFSSINDWSCKGVDVIDNCGNIQYHCPDVVENGGYCVKTREDGASCVECLSDSDCGDDITFCQNNMCVTNECSDSDGGINKYEAGFVIYNGEYFYDVCRNAYELREYKCNSYNYVEYNTFYCNCLNGVCR